MYWLQWSATLSWLAILAHAGPVQKAGDALTNSKPNSGLTITTMIIRGTPMPLTVVGSSPSPMVHPHRDSTPSTNTETEPLYCKEDFLRATTDEDAHAAGPTFWEWSKNLTKTSKNRPHGESELQIYAQEMLGWQEDMQCGDKHEGCVKLPTCDYVRTRVKNDALAKQIYLAMVAVNNTNQCSRMIRNHPKTKKNLGGRCQHVADQVQLPPVEHFLSLCEANYHWPIKKEHAKAGHHHEMQRGADARCEAMYKERDEAAKKLGNSSLAMNCHFCHNSTLGEEIKKVQRTYVRDYTGNAQNTYNFKVACGWYKEVDDEFYKGLDDSKGCVRIERGHHL